MPLMSSFKSRAFVRSALSRRRCQPLGLPLCTGVAAHLFFKLQKALFLEKGLWTWSYIDLQVDIACAVMCIGCHLVSSCFISKSVCTESYRVCLHGRVCVKWNAPTRSALSIIYQAQIFKSCPRDMPSGSCYLNGTKHFHPMILIWRK